MSDMSPRTKKLKESGIYNTEVSAAIASLVIVFGLAASYPNADLCITSLWHRVIDATFPEDKADIISIILAESTGAFSSFLFHKILDYAFRDEITWKLTSTEFSSEIAVMEGKHMVLSDLVVNLNVTPEIKGRMLKVMEKSYSWPSGNSENLPKEKTKMYPALIGVDIIADILKWLSYDVYSTHWQIFFEKFPYYSASSHGIERLIIGGMAGFTYHLYMDVVKYILNYDDAHMTRGKKYMESPVLSESYVTEIVAASVLFYVYNLSKSPVSTWVLESCGG